MVTAAEWARVQEIERRYHEQKDPAQILDINMAYWERILQALPGAGVEITPATRVLDVGCGGAGILLGVKHGIKTGVDPLMAYYLEKFPFLKQAPVRWIAGTAEEFAAGERFDVVFAVNSLDHVYDPRVSAQNLERLLAPGGELVLVLNVHLTRIFRAYFARFYPWVDPPHPHQIHRDDVAGYFPNLDLAHLSDIDHLWLDLEQRYKDTVCHRKKRDLAKLARNLANPFQYPLAAARVFLRRPVHRRRPAETPLMASMLYIFSRAKAGA